MSFTHPKDAEIKALYLGGMGFKAVAIQLGIGRSVVEYSLHRQGVMRSPVDRLAGKENEIIALAKTGVGWKGIIRRLGINCTSPIAIRTLLKKNGLATQWKDGRQNRLIELRDGTDSHWDKHFALPAALCFEEPLMKPKPTAEDKAAKAKEYYYTDHQGNKRKARARAYNRYWSYERTDPREVIERNLRRIVVMVMRQVKGKRRTRRKEDILGCTYDEARAYILAQSPPEWTLANYGSKFGIWEVDHYPAICTYDLHDPAQLREAAHYTRLRPLTCAENRSLGAKQKRSRGPTKIGAQPIAA